MAKSKNVNSYFITHSKTTLFFITHIIFFLLTKNNNFSLIFDKKSLVIKFIIMQQKNNFPQNHQQVEMELTAPPLKCLYTKFLNALNQPSQQSLKNVQKTNSCSLVKTTSQVSQIIKSNEHYSTLSILDQEDILFLEQFDGQDQKSQIFRLTANKQKINYTESVVIVNENTILHNEQSIQEQSQPLAFAHPFKKMANSNIKLLKKQSQIKFNNGGVFKGEMKNGMMINGTFVLDSMFTYRGELKNDKFHGNGTLSFVNGHVITCIWQQGKPVGHVTIQYPKGQRYEGELLNFKKHGIGCLHFTDGSRYVGEFKNGELTGQGCFYSANREEKRGYWINGEFQSQISSNNGQPNNHFHEKSKKNNKANERQRYRQRVCIH